MSVIVNFSKHPIELRHAVVKNAIVQLENSPEKIYFIKKYKEENVDTRLIQKNDVLYEGKYHVPFSLARQMITQMENISSFRLHAFPKFNANLRHEQVNIFENAKSKLVRDRVVMISCYTGFGKTVTTLALTAFFKLKTLVVVHRICLVDQWKESIRKFLNEENVPILPLCNPEESDESYLAIINIANINKLQNIEKYHLVIFDETHLLLSEKRSLNLLKLVPKMLIGLTATPYRPDNLDKAFKLFFGTNYILMKLHKLHFIYEVRTNLKILEKKMYNGKLDWNFVLQQQSENEQRNNLIIKIILKTFPNRNWLVLVKRKIQATILEEKLKHANVSVTTLIGNEREYNREAQVLIGTVGKIGTGFDHPKLNALILGADMVEFYIQFLGRVMRTSDNPIIIDFVDDHPVLHSHFKKRKQVYLEHGGVLCQLPLTMNRDH
jgi:superfamily II DNA or RNA helicase